MTVVAIFWISKKRIIFGGTRIKRSIEWSSHTLYKMEVILIRKQDVRRRRKWEKIITHHRKPYLYLYSIYHLLLGQKGTSRKPIRKSAHLARLAKEAECGKTHHILEMPIIHTYHACEAPYVCRCVEPHKRYRLRGSILPSLYLSAIAVIPVTGIPEIRYLNLWSHFFRRRSAFSPRSPMIGIHRRREANNCSISVLPLYRGQSAIPPF